MASAVVKSSQEILQNVEDDTNDALKVNIVAGSASGTEYTEDAAAAGDPVGTALILVRTDTPAARTSTDGDNVAACGTNKGELLVKQTDAVPVTDNAGSLTVDGTVSVNLNAGTNTNEVVGDAAHDAAVAGNPVLIGLEARSTSPAAVNDGDVVRAEATLLGKQIVYPWGIPAASWSYAAASGGITNTTGVTIKAAAGAGVRIYLTDLHVINGHASTSTDVQIRDGASGTVLWRGFAQAGGGGISVHFAVPLRGTANTLLEVACGTTAAAVYVNASGFVAAE